MGRYAVRTLKVVIALALVGSLVVQLVMVPLAWLEMDEAPARVRVPFLVIVVLGVAALQVIGVCIWRLLTMVREGTVFSHGAFRYVDIVIGAIGSASVLVLGVAVVGSVANRTLPGDVIAPGLVGFICGISLVVAGVALVVYVLRMLLAQAVATAARAESLRSELDEVI
ncbi:DUF2975 domain-containing protein [Georgenia sp. H159]|uniref:DUF2975 domain-containing protein n=1 Tax=Georgenia sp. H159 TaxID=3076115 RepID=UPI002D77FB27|nr:DUF2975 domain-containing protein [Georgenia sp. H159]